VLLRSSISTLSLANGDRVGLTDSLAGSGDAIWQALPDAAEIVCVADRDRIDDDLVDRLSAPLLEDPALLLVNGVHQPADSADPRSGDRLLELVARPLARRYEPAVGALQQPLAYAFAARRTLLGSLWLPAGAGVHLSLLIDTLRAHGGGALREVQLDRPRIDDRPLRALGADACALISAMQRRLSDRGHPSIERLMMPWDDLAAIHVETAERPPRDTGLGASDVNGVATRVAQGL
jgi:hypothetical protein